MKTLIKFVLVLAIGVILGYVFSNPIDAKLKSKLGYDRVEKLKVQVEKGVIKGVDAGKAAVEAGADAVKKELEKE